MSGEVLKEEGAEARVSRWKLAAAAVALLAVLAAAAACAAMQGDGWYDGSASPGSGSALTEEEIREGLNEKVEEGTMNATINAVIVFPDGQSKGSAGIVNREVNRLDQKVSIYLRGDDGSPGECVYQSKAIAPGTGIEEISLSRVLEPGSHPALAVVTGYDPETREAAGSVAVEVSLVVGG